jgi:hypothetical protein
MAWLWGFSVDDALISARVAAHLGRGLGYRFNAGGPVVDAVTPLGWAYVLAPASGGSALAAMYFAKWLGAAAWLGAALWLGTSIARAEGRGLRWVVLVPLSVCAPLAAWCVAGMETGVVVALATLALSESRAAPVAAGLAAALRPELVPWSVALAVGRAVAARRGGRAVARAAVVAAAPAAVAALVRAAAFGHAVPLAVWAKPSDFAHGLRYALGALIWTGAPLLVVAPRAVRRLDAASRAILVASAVHVVALVLAGGDWMSLFRLFVPVLPGLFLVGARLLALASPWASVLRLAAASAVSGVLLLDKGAVARGVLAQRLALIDEARPLLAGARRVATLDVGWVGAATDAELVDLAGVTDESIARLPGGHTSKRISPRLLEHRQVDALVLLVDLVDGPVPEDFRLAEWARAVEARVSREAAELGFVVRASLELRGTRQRYLVLRLQPGP